MTRIVPLGRRRMSLESRRLNTVHRRNGKLQSCEPCRKGKLRCDHMLPTCSRCTRRNRAEQCVYHPAPLTRAKTGPAAAGNENALASPTASTSTAQLPSPQSSASVCQESLVGSSSSKGKRPENDGTTYLPAATGFLGSTSYAAVFAEHQGSLDLENEMDILSVPVSVSETRAQRGMEVLSLLADLPLYDKMIDRWFKICPGVVVIEPVLKQWTSELWASHHKTLRSKDQEALRSMSELVWRNTQSLMKFNNRTSPREWMSLCTGQNLRWEVVGIIHTVVGLLALTLLDVDPIFDTQDEQRINRREFAARACEASEMCISFCRDLSILNDLILWLMYENTFLLNRIRGKSSYVVWQRTGELANALIAMGLHQEIKEDEQTPFFLSQFRKKQFIFAFASDKAICTFLGRPPRLQQRYCLLQLPLDLTDTQIMSVGEGLEAAIASLDKEGWNPSGKVHMCTAARVYVQQARIREDILELSLGVSSEGIVERVAQIHERADSVYSGLPDFLRRDDDITWDHQRTPLEELFRVYVRLEWLHHQFLLQRALIKRAGAGGTKLIEVAAKLFKNVLLLIHNRDSMRDFQLDLCVMIYNHGLPSAAVLAIELLRQDQNPAAVRVPLPRSDTIQDLAVFTAALSSLSVLGDRQSIADQGRKFLKGALDKILSLPTSFRPGAGEATVAAAVGDANMPDADAGNSLFAPEAQILGLGFEAQFPLGSDTDFMRWLDTMEGDVEPFQGFGY